MCTDKHAVKMAETKESVFVTFLHNCDYIQFINFHSNNYIIGYVCQLIIAIVMITAILHQ